MPRWSQYNQGWVRAYEASHGVKRDVACPDVQGKASKNQPRRKRSVRVGGGWIHSFLQDIRIAVNSNLDVKRGGRGRSRGRSGRRASLPPSVDRRPDSGRVPEGRDEACRRTVAPDVSTWTMALDMWLLALWEETRQVEGIWPQPSQRELWHSVLPELPCNLSPVGAGVVGATRSRWPGERPTTAPAPMRLP